MARGPRCLPVRQDPDLQRPPRPGGTTPGEAGCQDLGSWRGSWRRCPGRWLAGGERGASPAVLGGPQAAPRSAPCGPGLWVEGFWAPFGLLFRLLCPARLWVSSLASLGGPLAGHGLSAGFWGPRAGPRHGGGALLSLWLCCSWRVQGLAFGVVLPS